MVLGPIKVGGFSVNDTLTAAEMNTANTEIQQAMDGFGGGGYSPSAPLVVAGSGLTAALTAIPTFTSNKTRNVIESFANTYKSSNFAPNAANMQQSSSTTASFSVRLLTAHDGATLTGVALYFKIATGHVSLPAVFPKLSLARIDVTAVAGGVMLNSGDSGSGLAISSAGTVAAYEDGGAAQTFTYVCNQNNVIDHSRHVLLLALTEESGANSQAGNLYSGAQLQFGSIADMRFP